MTKSIIALMLALGGPFASAADGPCGGGFTSVPRPDLVEIGRDLGAVDISVADAIVDLRTSDDEVGRVQMKMISAALGDLKLTTKSVSDVHGEVTLSSDRQRTLFLSSLAPYHPLLASISVRTHVRETTSDFDAASEPSIDGKVIEALRARQDAFDRDLESLNGVYPRPVAFPEPMSHSMGRIVHSLDHGTLERGPLITTFQDSRRGRLELARHDDPVGICTLRLRDVFAHLTRALGLGEDGVFRIGPVLGKEPFIGLSIEEPRWAHRAEKGEIDHLFASDALLRERVVLLENLSGVRLTIADFWISDPNKLSVHVVDANRIAAGAVSPFVRPLGATLPARLAARIYDGVAELKFASSRFGVVLSDDEARELERRLRANGLKPN